jgi:hypothetical protein
MLIIHCIITMATNMFDSEVVKYLQNDVTYKYFFSNEPTVPDELTEYLYNKNTYAIPQITNKRYLVRGSQYDSIYIISDSSKNGLIYIIVLYWNKKNNTWIYRLSNIKYSPHGIYSNYIFRSCDEYPSIISNHREYAYVYDVFDDGIIKMLNETKILNHDYRNNKFNEITITCIEIIICLNKVLYKDITLQIIKIFFESVPHWNDFVWYKKMKNNSIELFINNSIKS